jgi:hypothetical protein
MQAGQADTKPPTHATGDTAHADSASSSTGFYQEHWVFIEVTKQDCSGAPAIVIKRQPKLPTMLGQAATMLQELPPLQCKVRGTHLCGSTSKLQQTINSKLQQTFNQQTLDSTRTTQGTVVVQISPYMHVNKHRGHGGN